MRKLFFVSVLLTYVPPGLAAGASGAVGAQSSRGDAHKVLLVGNSLTERNDLAAAAKEALLRAFPKRSYEIKAVTGEGYSLRQHLDGEASGLLRACEYEAVVLQERGSLTSSWVMNGVRQHGYPQEYLDVVGAFVQLVSACGTKVYVYETWSRNADDMPYIRYANRLVEEDHGVKVIPIGDYVLAHREDADKPTLGADGYHPSRDGTRLAAALIADQVSAGELCRRITSSREALATSSYVRACSPQQVSTLREAQRPKYVPEPVLEPFSGETGSFQGAWSSTQGGTRLSFLTIMDFAEGGVVSVTEHTALARLKERAPVVVREDGLAEFSFLSSGVTLNVAARSAAAEMRVLTRSGPADRRSYASASYYRTSGSDSYKDRLSNLYDSLDAARNCDQFVAVVRLHYPKLSALLKEEELASQADQISPDEWDLLLPATSFERNGDADRADMYLKAATMMYQGSVDASLAYADFLAKRSRNVEAEQEYLRARELVPAHDVKRAEEISKKLHLLRTRS